MAISIDSLERRTANKPARLIIYGPPGLGKTTLASEFPNPVFIQTEDGLGNLDVAHFPLANSIKDVLYAIGALYTD